MAMPLWLTYALLSALCASLVAVFAKIGMAGVNPNLATAIRSCAMTVLLLGVTVAGGAWRDVGGVRRGAWVMIVLSGVAGAMSWLFQFRALALQDVSKVAPVDKLSMPLGVVLAVLILGERPSAVNWLGLALVVLGAYLASMKA